MLDPKVGRAWLHTNAHRHYKIHGWGKGGQLSISVAEAPACPPSHTGNTFS